MKRLTQSRLQDILRQDLKLKDPEFRLRSHAGRISGSVISKTFRGKGDRTRQGMIWDALDYALGLEAEKLVGMILAYTPQEWYADEIAMGTWPVKAKAG